MSKSRRDQRAGNQEQPTWQPAPPLKPHPKIFWGLMILIAVWIVFLVTLYFTTVVPRERQQSTQPTKPVSAAAIPAVPLHPRA